VIIIHHCGVSGDRPRGHTSLTGAADTQLAVSREGDRVIIRVEYMKDGPEGAEIVSHLERVPLGVDDDGDEISSCVVVAVEGVPAAATAKQKLKPRQSNALDALRALIAAEGSELPSTSNFPPGVSGVPVERWREELLIRGVVDRAGTNPRSDFKRLKDAMKARGLICEREERIWMV
jgi:hypothetical protein